MMKWLALMLLAQCSGSALSAEGPPWKIFCQLKSKDEFGDAQARYCSMGYTNFSRDYVGERPIQFGTFFIIDQTGIKFTGGRPPTVEGCRAISFRFAVDNNRIDQLNNSTQIEAILSGTRFTREEQQPFPNCAALPHSMTLEGLSENFKNLKMKWIEANPPAAKRKQKN